MLDGVNLYVDEVNKSGGINGRALDVMVKLAKEGMTMCVVTHEMGFARQVAHRVIFMDEGQILESSTPDQFFDNPQTDRAAYFISKILTQ